MRSQAKKLPGNNSIQYADDGGRSGARVTPGQPGNPKAGTSLRGTHANKRTSGKNSKIQSGSDYRSGVALLTALTYGDANLERDRMEIDEMNKCPICENRYTALSESFNVCNRHLNWLVTRCVDCGTLGFSDTAGFCMRHGSLLIVQSLTPGSPDRTQYLRFIGQEGIS